MTENNCWPGISKLIKISSKATQNKGTAQTNNNHEKNVRKKVKESRCAVFEGPGVRQVA